MTTCSVERGFTLIELVVVLAVLGVLLGTAVPLVSAVVDSDRRSEAVAELEELGEALESYYWERASFPASLTASGFLGGHLQPGVRGTAVRDPFSGGEYRYSFSGGVATVYSVGEDGVDAGSDVEEYVVRVHAAVPGAQRTWMRLRLCVELLAEHIEAGGSVGGDWPSVRAAVGLGSSFDRDGWGTRLDWDPSTHTLRSAGADRVLGTADDLTI